MEKNRLVVRIYDQDIPVTTSGNAEFVKDTAAFVDNQMKAIADSAQIKDTAKIAIVTCMNIAAELKLLQQQINLSDEEFTKRANSISRSIDQLLEMDI